MRVRVRVRVRGRSRHGLFVRVRVEAHQHRLSDSHRRRAQVSGGAEELGGQFIVGGVIGSQVDAGHLLAFGDDERVHAFQERRHVLLAEALLLGVHGLGGLNVMGRKKLLRTGA